jgi:hypothetical protein
VLTGNTQFEQELRKVIATEIDRIKDLLAAGIGVPTIEVYRHYTGQIDALRRVEHSYCEEIETKLSKQR